MIACLCCLEQYVWYIVQLMCVNSKWFRFETLMLVIYINCRNPILTLLQYKEHCRSYLYFFLVFAFAARKFEFLIFYYTTALVDNIGKKLILPFQTKKFSLQNKNFIFIFFCHLGFDIRQWPRNDSNFRHMGLLPMRKRCIYHIKWKCICVLCKFFSIVRNLTSYVINIFLSQEQKKNKSKIGRKKHFFSSRLNSKWYFFCMQMILMK